MRTFAVLSRNKLVFVFLFTVLMSFASVGYAEEDKGDSELAGAPALPERYLELGLESVDEVLNFRYRRFRDGDRQSLVVRNSRRESYLLVFNQPIPPRNSDVALSDRNLRAGFTRACLGGRSTMASSSRGYYDRSSMKTARLSGSRSCPFRVEAIYPLENMEQENKVIKFLRAND